MRIFSLILIVVGCFSWGKAQNIVVQEDSEVSRVMDQYGATNRMTYAVNGWRIQLLATTDRIKMERTKEEFLQKYPDISVDWIHSSPYYKLLAGAFASKIEAARVLHLVKKDYPSAFPSKSRTIKPGEFVGLRYN